MQTLYIDVYFLINFTVDVLSLCFAALFAKVPTSFVRVIVSSVFGALFASFVLFLPDNPILKMLLSALALVIMGALALKKVKARRRVKFVFSFVIFEALVGGGVSLFWNLLDTYLYGYINSASGGAVNRKLLFFAMIVLLSIGVFKMFVCVFNNNECESCVRLEIGFMNSTVETEALVDTGNLAIDPMDMHPILFVKPDVAEKLFPQSVIELSDPDNLDREVRKRIRLIPISRMGQTQVLTGVRPDAVRVVNKSGKEEICVTIAIDKEGGSFGGYGALIPAAALGDATD